MLTSITPTAPVAPWMGGKRNLARRICAIIDNFGVSKDRPGRFNLTTLEPMLEDLHSRLAGVVIECLDWADFIPRYDSTDTLFYLDPPY